MDVSVNPVLESVRPFFQGLPANNTPSPATSVSNNLPSHPAVATPVQPSQHGFQNNPPSSIPSSSPSVLSYWPLSGSQRTKEPQAPSSQPHYAQSPSAKSPALASPLHHVYNGTKISEPLQTAETQRHQHNLPPIAALSSNMAYQHSRAVLRDQREHASATQQTALLHRQQQQHLPLPSISQITPHSTVKTSTSSASPRSTQSQFRAPDYPQSNHHSIYSPNSSNQSLNRNMSGSSYQTQMMASKYQSSPSSPAASTPSPHAYSYSPRTSLALSSATTASSPVYPQTTSAASLYVSSSHHHRQQMQSGHIQQPQQNRPPSNQQQHQTHHPMSPVIQQPNQQADVLGQLKLHHQLTPLSQHQPHAQHTSSQQPQQTLPQHQSNQQQQPTHSQYPSSHQQASPSHHSSQQQPPTHPQHPNNQQAQQTHSQYPSSHQQPSPSHHSSQQQPPTHPQHSSNHQLTSPHSQQGLLQHPSSQQQHQTHTQHMNNQQQQSHPQQHPSHSQQQVIHQQYTQSSSGQPTMQTHQHQMHQSLANYQQQHKSGNQQQQSHSVQQMLHQQSIQGQHHQTLASQHLKHEHSSQNHSQSLHQSSQQSHSRSSVSQHHQQPSSQQLMAQQQHNQHLLSQQHHQLQQQAALYNQTVQQNIGRQSDAEKLAEMQQVLRMKQRQLAAVQAQQQAYYASASSSSSSRSSSQTTTTTIEASNHQRTTTTQALTGGVKRESPLDLSVKTVRQSADSTAKDDPDIMYLTNYQSHEFQHRSKTAIKTASPRNSAVLPPLQLPSTVVYPQFENHTANQTAGSGAPKVDFLPNFNAHHSSASGSSGSYQDSNKRQRKSTSSQQINPSQYPPNIGSLPHMGSFKKSSLPSAAYDDPNKQSQYYPATGPPSLHRSSAHNSHPIQPAFTGSTGGQFPYDSSKRGSSTRYEYLERRTSTNMQSAPSNESSYALGKRQSSLELKHPQPPKIPRVVDTWRQTIDQQIEQRLNSYASSRGHQVNGTTKESNLNDPTFQQQTVPSFSAASSSNIQASHSAGNLSTNNSVPSRSSLFSSHRSNSSSKLDLASQYYSHNQTQYPSHNVPQRTMQEPYNNLAQVKIPTLPNNGAADKRVLSILRKRLDTREATNQLAQQQLQQQNQSAHHQDRSKMYSSAGSRSYPQQLIVPSPVTTSQGRLPLQPPLGRHNLPPFNALNLERNPGVSYSSQKLHIPKAMDSVVPDHSHGNLPSRLEVSSRPPQTTRAEAAGKPESGGDFDGLAAFLAARIRTKAELKQVGPSLDQQRTPTPASGSNSSAHSPRTTPGIFSPPPSTQMHHPAVPGDFGKGTPTSESDRASSSGISNSSPLKASRDRYNINSPRRRLFCRPDDESGGTNEGVIQAREVGLRSSSETSVFDFRESDSDGETASERQSLNEMRKDRDRRLQEKHQTMTVPSPEPMTDTPEIDSSGVADDSFWSGMCDQFVNQLEKGGNKVRKRGRRKKWIYTPIEPLPIETIDQYDDVQSETSSIVPGPELENIKTEKEGSENNIQTIVKEEILPPDDKRELAVEDNIKMEEESSDEDVPLSLRQTELKKEKETVIIKSEGSVKEEKNIPVTVIIKSESSVKEEKNILVVANLTDKPSSELEDKKEDDVKKECSKQEVNKESSDSEAESSADESIESVAKRLRIRKPKEEVTDKKRKTRSSEKENSSSPQKGGKKKKEEKKKSLYGDGSEFRPGWEAEVYRYKRSLRMPARLINIAGPQSWPRLSVSLPDLDPDSPMTLDSEISLQNKKFESDSESTPTKTKSTDSSKTKASHKKPEEKVEEDSFINRLIQRYGGKGKKSLRKAQEKDTKEKKGPKIIPQTNELQLLPTPSLDCIVKSPLKKADQNGSHSKQPRGRKSNKESEKPTDAESRESVYLGYFRKKTVADFRDAFAKHNGGFATEHELPPIMLKSRTRTQTRILTQRATIREVFGDDRPASAPPAGCREEDHEENEKSSEDKKSKKVSGKNKALLKKRSSNSGIAAGTRSGLRSAAVLRSNKAVLKSKQHLLHGGERRKRSKDLIKAYSSGKKYHQDTGGKHSTIVEAVIKLESQEDIDKVEEDDDDDEEEEDEDESPVLVNEKRLKYRNVRRKLKSSGFDYIRKKKKQQQKKEGDNESVKEKRKAVPPKANLESEEDIQNEIKGWVINKGLGETVLHRAARLGYTDIAAYCLEKMDHNPSPRDNAGYTPLHEACSKGRLDIAKLLLLYGADASDSAQGGIRPLHEAAENGCLELIRLLLSYGADPLLATYSGLTPLSLTYNNPEARALLTNHLADVQGLPAPPWQIQLTDPSSSGCDPLTDPPSLDPCEDVEVECAELSLPHLYQLLGEPHTDRWVLFQELGPVLKVKTREALIKQLGQSHRNDFRDLKMTDFYDMARCCSILGIGDYILNPKAHKVTLVKYSERVRALLNSEKIMITAR